MELNRDQSASSLERVFRVTGSPDQMQHAIRLISEKAGIVSLGISSSKYHPYRRFNSVFILYHDM